ncbi:uncharacterized protein METZ01_LOCUS51407 [marine metagenome]|uniref:Uncharacterized protein n=1 Tax=marine metagenome TaxID=408172 RepID=A0A381SBN3_9ZZZZ
MPFTSYEDAAVSYLPTTLQRPRAAEQLSVSRPLLISTSCLADPQWPRVHFMAVKFCDSLVRTNLHSTNPNPRDLPVSRSVIMRAELTDPNVANSSRNASSLALHGRVPF